MARPVTGEAVGAVLEMSGASKFSGLLIGMLVALSGCSSATDKAQADADAAPLFQMLKGFSGLFKKSARPVDPRKLITREAIDASPVKVLLAGIELRNAYATLSPAGENAGVITWISGDGIGLGFRQGVLVSTRGLGPDLMAANVSGTIMALHNGQGETVRIHDYLDGENQIRRSRFRCDVQIIGSEVIEIYGLQISTRHLTENCKNREISFKNHYWLSSGNKIWQSRQWIGRDLEYVFVQQLSR